MGTAVMFIVMFGLMFLGVPIAVAMFIAMIALIAIDPVTTQSFLAQTAYGGVAGFLYSRSRWQCVIALYRSLIIAMVGGRLVWGPGRVVVAGVAGGALPRQIFLAGALLNAIPGIILQLVFIPAVMVALDRTGMVPFRRGKAEGQTAGT